MGEQLTYFLGEVHAYDPQGLAKYLVPGTIPILEQAIEILEDTVSFNAMSLEEKFRKAAAAESGRKFADYVHPMRLAITGRLASPNLFELIEILGKGRCIVRFKRFIQMIKGTLVAGQPKV